MATGRGSYHPAPPSSRRRVAWSRTGKRQKVGGSPTRSGGWEPRLSPGSQPSLAELTRHARQTERRMETERKPSVPGTTAVGREFYDRQVQYLVDHDTDTLIDEHYNDDATPV